MLSAVDETTVSAFNLMMRADDLDFVLPPELIAQTPPAERGSSRLLHYKKSDRSIAHRMFPDLPSLLRADDLLVFNDARVLPARFTLRKITGGRIEGLFLHEIAVGRWRVMLRDAAGATQLHFADAPESGVKVISPLGDGEFEIEVAGGESAAAILARLGRMPLPPYIKRGKDHDDRDEADKESYQTVYAKASGSVAAPTAGLHFTRSLLDQLDQLGIERATVTLHVGLGTFKPVSANTLEDHRMHSERFELGAEAAEKINRAQACNRRIVAVGTTSARVLESLAADAPLEPKMGETSIFIYPPYTWKRVGALITNFHLPRSTLIALVAAMVGLNEQRRIYQTAIENRYRFFSYGDAMLLE
jgi:S-adenosylmethionine:tRNA ribosyltransferase-isomerase